MRKYSVRITVKNGEVFVYTTEMPGGQEAMTMCGLLFRMSGHDTGTIDEIAVHEIF